MRVYAAVMLILFISAGASAALAGYVFYRSHKRKLPPSLGWLFLFVALYISGYAFELGAPDLRSLLLVMRYEYLGIAFIPVAWVRLLAELSSWRRPRLAAALASVIPLITLALVWTVERHSLYYISPEIRRLAGLTIFSFEKGSWYFVQGAYFNVVFAWSTYKLFRLSTSGAKAARGQAVYLLAGCALPWAGNLAYLLGLVPYGIDPSPFALGLAIPLFAYGYFRYRLFDLAPLARASVFEQMRDAVFVLDEEARLVDLNESCEALFKAAGLSGCRDAWLGRPFDGLFGIGQPLATAKEAAIGSPAEYEARSDGGTRYYELASLGLEDARGRARGYAYTAIDVTERRAAAERLRYLADTDALTGLASRRRFFELAEREYERSVRYGRPIGMAMLDLDDFKSINDRYGHAAGDKALKLCAELCRGALRSCDIAGRIGGDEFAFVLPECDDEASKRVALKIKSMVGSASLDAGGGFVRLSASVGAAGSETPAATDLDQLLEEADRRMYMDKTSASPTDEARR